ncbi:hypothetical protein ON010_g6438 [Phytophthora cinnamomi]|nr:hypothetical protein ON010_g6438 [Phytophthora cinnamomi]
MPSRESVARAIRARNGGSRASDAPSLTAAEVNSIVRKLSFSGAAMDPEEEEEAAEVRGGEPEGEEQVDKEEDKEDKEDKEEEEEKQEQKTNKVQIVIPAQDVAVVPLDGHGHELRLLAHLPAGDAADGAVRGHHEARAGRGPARQERPRVRLRSHQLGQDVHHQRHGRGPRRAAPGAAVRDGRAAATEGRGRAARHESHGHVPGDLQRERVRPAVARRAEAQGAASAGLRREDPGARRGGEADQDARGGARAAGNGSTTQADGGDQLQLGLESQPLRLHAALVPAGVPVRAGAAQQGVDRRPGRIGTWIEERRHGTAYAGGHAVARELVRTRTSIPRKAAPTATFYDLDGRLKKRRRQSTEVSHVPSSARPPVDRGVSAPKVSAASPPTRAKTKQRLSESARRQHRTAASTAKPKTAEIATSPVESQREVAEKNLHWAKLELENEELREQLAQVQAEKMRMEVRIRAEIGNEMREQLQQIRAQYQSMQRLQREDLPSARKKRERQHAEESEKLRAHVQELREKVRECEDEIQRIHKRHQAELDKLQPQDVPVPVEDESM